MASRGETAGRPTLPERAALAWLDGDRRARLIVTASLRLLWQNRAAAELLAGDAGILLSDGMVLWKAPATHQAVLQLVARGEPGTATLVVNRPDGERLLIRATTVAIGADAAVCLEMVLDSAAASPVFADIDRAFGLTSAEHQVVLGLLRGRRVGDLARDRRVSEDTVRSHVRGIYAKLGVASREELFKRLSPYCIS